MHRPPDRTTGIYAAADFFEVVLALYRRGSYPGEDRRTDVDRRDPPADPRPSKA